MAPAHPVLPWLPGARGGARASTPAGRRGLCQWWGAWRQLDRLPDMEPWDGCGTALIAAVVSVAVSLAIRLWESHRVEWLVTGEAHEEYESGRATGRIRANVEFHNVGDGDAFRVLSVRSNGSAYEPFWTFEKGKIGAGETVAITMSVEPAHWEEAWAELLWESSPTARSKTSRTGPRLLSSELWRYAGIPPRVPDHRWRLRRPAPLRRHWWQRRP